MRHDRPLHWSRGSRGFYYQTWLAVGWSRQAGWVDEVERMQVRTVGIQGTRTESIEFNVTVNLCQFETDDRPHVHASCACGTRPILAGSPGEGRR
jgi:hypothetical protein